MAKVFGIANNTPDAAITVLAKGGHIKALNAVSILPTGGSLKIKPKHKVIFMLCMSDLMRNLSYVNDKSYSGYIFFVFAAPTRLAGMHGITPVDYAPDPAHRAHGFLLRPLKVASMTAALSIGLKSKPMVVQRKDEDFVVTLVDRVIKGSLLNPLMTFLYTLPSATHQTPLKVKVAQWLYDSKSVPDLFKSFDALKQVQLTQRHKDKFAAILDSDIGRNFQAFFKDYRVAKKLNPTLNIDALCKKHSVDPYEVRYLLSVLNDVSKQNEATKHFRHHKAEKSIAAQGPQHSKVKGKVRDKA